MNSILNIRATLLVSLFILMSITAQSQDIRFIILEYSTAVKPVNASVKVTIKPNTNNTYNLKVESVSLQQVDPAKSIDKEITITERQFNYIVNAIQGIKQTEIIGGPHPSLLDGEACSISYGSLGTAVSFHVNTPKYDSDKRKLNGFLRAYELILRTAELDPNKILG
ncbi:hypothetical protein [Pontibacter litorisediminis]|uniref:hypothetical protein n=1 Tax=Pontibacter litorisediminis TaxID=1846260 RepID=UPI0023EB4327|nr:hypothetical protein [Pontibacter litorisediminis]